MLDKKDIIVYVIYDAMKESATERIGLSSVEILNRVIEKENLMSRNTHSEIMRAIDRHVNTHPYPVFERFFEKGKKYFRVNEENASCHHIFLRCPKLPRWTREELMNNFMAYLAQEELNSFNHVTIRKFLQSIPGGFAFPFLDVKNIELTIKRFAREKYGFVVTRKSKKGGTYERC